MNGTTLEENNLSAQVISGLSVDFTSIYLLNLDTGAMRPYRLQNKYINDIAGIRIICSFTTDIYRIAEMIRSQRDIEVVKIKDYIENPKRTGYTSYHMIVRVPVYLKVEIQIRTVAMDFWATLEHKIQYKFETNIPGHIKKELVACATMVTALDRKMLQLNEEVQALEPRQEAAAAQ